jgi:hypothetical protein
VISRPAQVGFGAGHSTVMFLNGNPNAKVYTFDIFQLQQFQKRAIEFIDEHFPGRQVRIVGDSNATIAKFSQQHPGACGCGVCVVRARIDLVHARCLSGVQASATSCRLTARTTRRSPSMTLSISRAPPNPG